MAVTLEELQIKFKSEIAAATGKDAAALARVDAAVRQSAQGLDALRGAHARNAAAARAAEREQTIANSQLRNARPEDMAKREAAARAANARAAKAAAAEEVSAARLGGAAGQHKALEAARPELVALAKRKNAVLDQGAAAKRAAAEQAAAAKKLEEQRKASGEEAATKRIEAMQAATLGAAGAALTLTAAIGGAAVAAAGFGLKAADAARSARLLAEALTGSKELGAEFDAVVTQLASKVPLARTQIADLARELSLMKLGRRDMQAGLTAIAITTSVIGDAAGGVIRGVVQSSAAMKRFTLGARDMWGEYTGIAGSGLKSMDVLSALAKQLGVGVGEVEKKLRLGQIKMKDGLRALEAATEARFGKTIQAQMLSINTQFSKAGENLAQMTAGVDLEPALNGLKELLSIFDENTVAGSVLKTVMTEGLGGLSRALGVLLPLGKDFFLEFAIGAMEIYLALRPIGRKIMEWVGPFLTAENAATAGKVAIYGVAAAFGLIAIAALAATAAIALPFVIAGLAIWALVAGVGAAWDWLVNDAGKAASNLVDSFIGMLKSGVDRAMSAASDLANKVSSAFKSALGIASPSKVFAAYGRYTVQGFAEGVDQEAGSAQGSVEDMAPTAPDASVGGGLARLGGGSTVYITMGDVYFGGQKATEEEKGGLVEFLRQQLMAANNAVGAGEPLGVPT